MNALSLRNAKCMEPWRFDVTKATKNELHDETMLKIGLNTQDITQRNKEKFKDKTKILSFANKK